MRLRDAERTFQALAAVRYRVGKDGRRGMSRAQAHAVRELEAALAFAVDKAAALVAQREAEGRAAAKPRHLRVCAPAHAARGGR